MVLNKDKEELGNGSRCYLKRQSVTNRDVRPHNGPRPGSGGCTGIEQRQDVWRWSSAEVWRNLQLVLHTANLHNPGKMRPAKIFFLTTTVCQTKMMLKQISLIDAVISMFSCMCTFFFFLKHFELISQGLTQSKLKDKSWIKTMSFINSLDKL